VIPGVSPAQACALEALLVEQGLAPTLHAVAELARAAAGRLGTGTTPSPSQRRWAAYGDRIDELARGLLEPDGRWETPLWRAGEEGGPR
jgi:hypothetical protein